MKISQYITVDPNICHGTPCFKGTRIMVHLVLEMLAAGESSEDIIKKAYPRLTKKHLTAALQYAADIAKEGHIVKISSKSYAVPRG